MERKHKILFLASFSLFIPLIALLYVESYTEDVIIIRNVIFTIGVTFTLFSILYYLKNTKINIVFKILILLFLALVLFTLVVTPVSFTVFSSYVAPTLPEIQEFEKRYGYGHGLSTSTLFFMPWYELGTPVDKDTGNTVYLRIKPYHVIPLVREQVIVCNDRENAIKYFVHNEHVLDYLKNYDCFDNGHTYPNISKIN